MEDMPDNNNVVDEADNKDYLQDLLLKIKPAFEQQDELTFRVIEPKEKGFTVKVGGLFAYIPYVHFGWTYPTPDYWKNASSWLVDCYFKGKVQVFSENPISIILNAASQVFPTPELDKYRAYRGIIVQKAAYGFFVDIGYHFKWKCGSLLGLLHKSALQKESDFDDWNAGDEIEILFQGFNEKGQLLLSNDRERSKWINGEIETLIGTNQPVTVTKDNSGYLDLKVLGKHKASVPMLKAYYPNSLPVVTKYLNNLQNEQTIYCEVVKMNKKRDGLILRLLIDSE